MQGVMQKLLTGGSVVFLALVLVNIGLFTTNQDMQGKVAERGQYIQQSLGLEKIYQPLVRALAELAASRNDGQIKTLLNEQGISFNATPQQPTANKQ
jgi:hypothetical protein